MKKDLDRLMKKRDVDTLVVMGEPSTCRDFRYLAGPLHLTGGYVVKKRGGKPILVVGLMERDEAARSGLPVRLYSEMGWAAARKGAKSPAHAAARFIVGMLRALECGRRVALYGTVEVGPFAAMLPHLKRCRGFEFVFEGADSIISVARMTKDEDEIDHIREVGRRAQMIYRAVVERFSSCRVGRGGALKYRGKPLTIGAMKRLIKKEADDLDLDVSREEVIFSAGRDAAVPHSRGDLEHVLRVGETIVFDFCPCEPGGGYFFDMTRTFCVGEVPERARTLWRQVLEVQTACLDALKPGARADRYDKLCSKMFERLGHPTPRSKPGTQEGYVHGLGHGIGLQIHERPRLSVAAGAGERLKPGMVFTVEPGLYYPDEGVGVRLEDVVAIHADGSIENLTPFSKEILVPLRKRRVTRSGRGTVKGGASRKTRG